MDIRERIEENSNNSYNTFRMGLDLGMGVIYIGLGAFFIIANYLGIASLPEIGAYVLGGLMIGFGGFRVFRGGKALLQRRGTPRGR